MFAVIPPQLPGRRTGEPPVPAAFRRRGDRSTSSTNGLWIAALLACSVLIGKQGARLRAAMEGFQSAIGAQIDLDRDALAMRWFERLTALIPVLPNDVFPTDALLAHIPDLIHEISRFIASDELEIAANSFVVTRARELGELRHAQHASVHQLLREYELLRNILETFVGEQTVQLGLKPHLTEVLRCVRKINQAVAVMSQTTVDTFVERYAAMTDDHTRRLEQFNQMVSHELRQPLSALQAAAALLRQNNGNVARRRRLIGVVDRNITRMADLVGTITKITSLKAPDHAPGVQRVSLTTEAREIARQLRDMARDRHVEVIVAPDMPHVTVDIGRLELILSNLLSNALKYADPAKSRRYVRISHVPAKDTSCTFQVRDNGLGMTPEQVEHVFTPYFRAHATRDLELGVQGLGLGLSIVRDCAAAIGASVALDTAPGEGATFSVTLPEGTSAPCPHTPTAISQP
jgi:signal transduction histidine kinase